MSFWKEFWRKTIHFLFGLLIPFLYWNIPDEKISKIILASFGAAFLVIETLRLQNRTVKVFFVKAFGSMIRDHEHSSLTGATYLVLSSLLCVSLYPKAVAVAAISYLVVGDTIAALIGKRIGRIRIFGKTLEGTLAFFVSSLVCGFLVPGLPHMAALAGAAAGAVIELLPIPLDDNVRIPLISGGVMLFVV
jgi:dolichol kinase